MLRTIPLQAYTELEPNHLQTLHINLSAKSLSIAAGWYIKDRLLSITRHHFGNLFFK